MDAIPQSTAAGILWPALLSPEAAGRLSIMYQLEQSQWWSPETLKTHQFRQVNHLLRHAFATTRFYHDRLAAAGIDGNTDVTPEIFSRIPLLQREETGRIMLKEIYLKKEGVKWLVSKFRGI